ncbi:MAG: small ribosomal subunit Rsm22 family protein [Acidobacteriales bacterium]|nr:small ribosomal subunit Rsm22 family protein [Terriglobales bacterium]
MHLPRALSAAIEEQVSRFDGKALARAAEALSLAYRRESQRTKGFLGSDLHRAAYLVTRMPATYAAVRAVLEEARLRLPQANITSLLDLGAGPGTAAWAAAEVFPSIAHITLLERNAELIRLGKSLAAHSPHSALAKAQWEQADLNSAVHLRPYDLVVLSYSLGELGAGEPLVRSAWAAVQVALAVVEPGTPRGFGTILDARRALLAAGGHVAAPCPHDRECPMVSSKNDWCHFAERLERSAAHRYAKGAGMGYEDEKFSYVVVTKPEVARVAARILRHPVKHKGHVRLELCTPAGLSTQTITRSERDAYRHARQAKWGSEWEFLNS